MTDTMRALRLDATFEPRSADAVFGGRVINASQAWKNPRLAWADVPRPVPGPGQVLLRVRACGVCGTDVHCRATDEAGYVRFSGRLQCPVIPGHEFTGDVVELGRDVRTLRVGDAVAAESICWCGLCSACRAGHFNQCHEDELVGLTVPGAFAEYVVVHKRQCWNIAPLRSAAEGDCDMYELGALLEPIGCAYNGLFVTAGGFLPGAHVAIFGAGPIGLGAVMLARAAGAATIIVFDFSAARNRLALALGADIAEDPVALQREGVAPSGRIIEVTRGAGADVAVEAAGAGSVTLPEMTRGLARNGVIVYLGRSESFARVDVNSMVSGAAGLIGSRGHAGGGVYANLIRLIATGRIPAARMITSRRAWADAIDAFDLAAQCNDGKVMVRMPGAAETEHEALQVVVTDRSLKPAPAAPRVADA